MAGVTLEIRTPRLRLRPLTPADADRVTENLNQTDVGRMIGTIPLPYPREMAHVGWKAMRRSVAAVRLFVSVSRTKTF